MMKPLIFLAVLVCCCCSLFGQQQGSGEFIISGTILEPQDQQPVEYATVVVKSNETEKIITGTTSGTGGRFSVRIDNPDVYLEISFIGYVTQSIRDLVFEGREVDLGTITLSLDDQLLDEVTVIGEKSTTEFELDKRVFNVGKDISTTGMSALEVLNNVPSVTVSIEGDIRLRGSAGVQILIDGKPSIMTDDRSNALGTITADMIESIEVITNPSAKYDAEGTSGILNIVLKKEERNGLNGSLSVNAGVPDNHSVGISLNRRADKFNLFAQLGAGYRSLPMDSENVNYDKVNNTTVSSYGTSYRNKTFYNVILGTDYHINRYNVVTLSGNFAYEIEDQPSYFNFEYRDETGSPGSEWTREEETEATNPKWQYDLQYTKEFKNNEKHTLQFNALGRFFGKDQSSDFKNTDLSGTGIYTDQMIDTKFQSADYTFKLDYTNPVTTKFTIEAGAQYVINDVGNEFAVIDLIDGEWVPNEGLTNDFNFDQKVLGAYGTGAFEGARWGLKLGMRVENTDLKTLLVNTGEANRQHYVNFFPSAHTSYKFTEYFSIQAGYSRRIFRPRLWDLNPFFNIRNNFNIRQGNPGLQPEFTDSYEITTILDLGDASVNAAVYHRYTTDVAERVTFFEGNTSITKPMNIGTNRITGFELNMKYDPVKWLTVNGDFNYGKFIRRGDLENQSFDFNGDQWTSRLNTKFKLPAGIDLELTGNFESGYQTVQGTISEILYADMGLRKKLVKGKAVINLGVRDVFSTRKRESVVDNQNFYWYNYDLRGRFITLGFSYGFGKGEAMTYSGSRRY